MPVIDSILRLQKGSHVFWAGTGNAPEMLSLALAHPDVQFVGVDPNGDAMRVAQKIARRLGLANVQLTCGDAMAETNQAGEPHTFSHIPGRYTHIYSTAISGEELHYHLAAMAAGCRLCQLDTDLVRDVWCGVEYEQSAPVHFQGSGRQRRLWARDLPGSEALDALALAAAAHPTLDRGGSR